MHYGTDSTDRVPAPLADRDRGVGAAFCFVGRTRRLVRRCMPLSLCRWRRRRAPGTESVLREPVVF
ncbi:hypothetical protein ACFPM0_23690 [Pseudonocardia sulfidoxydans]|uniref:hypothetical protein n=1 Tax=Pseudonocardia sulfidoxydans TaxID=54011 RepID=UPI00361CA21D